MTIPVHNQLLDDVNLNLSRLAWSINLKKLLQNMSYFFVLIVLISQSVTFSNDSNIKVITEKEWINTSISIQKNKLVPHSKTIQKITIHHTATPNNKNTKATARLRGIRYYHIKEKGWGDIAYHYLISSEGEIYQGRNSKYIGSSSTNYDLDNNLLIALIGNFEVEKPTNKALLSLKRLIVSMLIEYGIKPDSIHTHKQQAETLCPGENLQAWYMNSGKYEIYKQYISKIDSSLLGVKK